MTLVITPETRVGQLLDSFPGIEQVLIDRVPAFAKLRNPILRKTVAKVATLDQAARIGGIAVQELVLMLRSAVGQSSDLPAAVGPSAAAPAPDDWVEEVTVTRHLDADAILARGEHPLGLVRACITGLGSGEALRLTSTFRPVPLIDALAPSGIRACCVEVSAGEFVTYLAPSL